MNLETRYNELNKDYGAYELVNIEKLNDLNSVGLLLKHKKSGARVAIISNDDDNKVFSIGFKTPPDNDTGMQHIIEHSTLCGSRKYPVKDPFVELCKGSLNTFLNAMTYPDKTVYPVAIWQILRILWMSIWMRYSILQCMSMRRYSSRKAGIMSLKM